MILQHFNLLPSSINHSVRVLYIKFLGNIFSKEFWYYQGKTSILFLRPSEVPVAEQPCLFKYYSGLLIFHSVTSAYPLFDKGERILWMSQPLLTLPALLYWSATNNAGKDECHAIGSKIMMAIMVGPRSVDSREGYWSGTKAASWNKSRANFALPRTFGRDLLALWGVLCISFVGKQFCFDGGSLALNTTFSSTTRETWRRLGMMSF